MPLKLLIAIMFTLMGYTFLHAEQSLIPSEIIYATDVYPAKDFILWKEKDLQKYSGTYSGDIGGDVEGSLTLTYQLKAFNDTLLSSKPLASGIYKQRTAGSFETVLLIKNAVSYEDAVTDAGPFSIIFVTFEKQKGAIVGKYFLPKQK